VKSLRFSFNHDPSVRFLASITSIVLAWPIGDLTWQLGHSMPKRLVRNPIRPTLPMVLHAMGEVVGQGRSRQMEQLAHIRQYERLRSLS
jgi:hypothetical protein